MEETTNNNPELLDIDPFSPGNATIFFNVFFKIVILGVTYHDELYRISGGIDKKP